MNNMKFIISTCFLIFAIDGARAADVVTEEPVPSVQAPAYWDGVYIGLQAGYGWGRSKVADGDLYITAKPDGFLGGVYAGYNFDLGSDLVLGLDADITYNDLSNGVDLYDDDGTLGATVDSKLRWSGAVRARAGYAIGRVMPYIAGGLALGDVQTTYSLDGTSWSESKTRTGWTAGVGLDYLATNNVMLRLEYRYVDLGKKDYFIETVPLSDNLKTDEVRVGISYKF